jgi:hypothetical protein
MRHCALGRGAQVAVLDYEVFHAPRGPRAYVHLRRPSPRAPRVLLRPPASEGSRRGGQEAGPSLS